MHIITPFQRVKDFDVRKLVLKKIVSELTHRRSFITNALCIGYERPSRSTPLMVVTTVLENHYNSLTDIVITVSELLTTCTVSFTYNNFGCDSTLLWEL